MAGTRESMCRMANSESHAGICGQDHFIGEMVWRKDWEGGGGGTVGDRERKKMHKQILAMGIDAISSVSQLMTNSMEGREEQKERSNGEE